MEDEDNRLTRSKNEELRKLTKHFTATRSPGNCSTSYSQLHFVCALNVKRSPSASFQLGKLVEDLLEKESKVVCFSGMLRLT